MHFQMQAGCSTMIRVAVFAMRGISVLASAGFALYLAVHALQFGMTTLQLLAGAMRTGSRTVGVFVACVCCALCMFPWMRCVHRFCSVYVVPCICLLLHWARK
ncbi:hypothetical protein COO60DRAFT_1507290 [Scenedesmus sp. NREL 46B-D3]|nr:hypothetical protein COO60DRAFT_1507290 [Scenedesmus sp. NREL 46B-D3]